MNTSNILLLGFLITAFILSGWFVLKARNHVNTGFIETSGNVISKKIDVPSFNKVKVQGRFRVNISQKDDQLVEVKADENIFPEVIAEVEGEELVLRLKNNIKDEDRVIVNIRVPEVNTLEFSAGASLSSDGQLTGEDLYINSYAGSEGNLDLKFTTITCDSKAGSNVELSGTTNRLVINSNAGSRVDAQDLEANICTVNGNAGSHVQVHANEELTASMSSGGALEYSGNPERKNFSTSAGGSISKE